MISMEIEALSTRGEGIARHEGKVYFIPRALPGERCRVDLVESKKNWGRAHVGEILLSSPRRVEPACPQYVQCGGCQLQHLDYSAQLEFKRGTLAETLRRIGHLEAEPEAVVSSAPLHYREKTTFSLIRDGERIRLAFHRWDRPGELVPVPACPQLVAELEGCLPILEDWINRAILTHPVPGLGRAVLRRMGDSLLAILLTEPGSAVSKGFVPAIPEPLEAVYLAEDRPGAPLRLLGSRIEARRFPSAFRQANRAIAEQLYRVVEGAMPADCGRVIDAYAGAGELTLRLAVKAKNTVGIELDRQAVEEARAEAQRMGLEARVHFHRGRAEELIRKRLPADYVVLDPPRSGCPARLIDALCETPPRRLAYISCHPAALARDLARLLESKFRLDRLVPFDMFPQTYHLEVLAVLEAEGTCAPE